MTTNIPIMDSVGTPHPDELYSPGICNIGGREVIRRSVSAWIHTGLVVLFTVMVLSNHLDHFWRFVVGLPAFFAALGFLQAGTGFCVRYGMTGFENMSGNPNAGRKITESTSHHADKIRSLQLVLASFFIALTVAMIIFLLPLT